MWTVLIGIGLGVLEMVLLKKSVAMMSASKANIPVGILITLGKLAFIVAILFLIAKFISIPSMLWCAGGLSGTMIVMSMAKGLGTIRKYRKENGGDV